MVKRIHLVIEDKIFEELKIEKEGLTWEQFLINTQRLKIGENRS